MGKLILAFLFCSASAVFAVHEARPFAPLEPSPSPAPPLDRVNGPELADAARFARPFYTRPLPPPAPEAPPPESDDLEQLIVSEATVDQPQDGPNPSAPDWPNGGELPVNVTENIPANLLTSDGRRIDLVY